MSDLASVPADDRGLLLGDGLFETVRLYPGVQTEDGAPAGERDGGSDAAVFAFRLEAHLARLEAGAAVVGIPVPADLRERVANAIRSARDIGRGAVLRVTLTRGSGWGLAPPEAAASRLFVSARPLGGAAGGPAAGPVVLTAKLLGRVDEHSLVVGLKTTNYLERIQALRLATAAGADEALLRNSREEIVEGSASNAIAVLGRTLVAPGRAQGALPGITREVVLDEARHFGYAVEERGIADVDLARADELLLTSSVRELVAVVRVEGRPVGDGVPGPVGRALFGAYREVVWREMDGG